jgi:hypothetical protein
MKAPLQPGTRKPIRSARPVADVAGNDPLKSRKITPGIEKEPPHPEAREVPLHGLIAAALEISDERAETLRRMKSALERGDDLLALEAARELCGLEHEQKSHRAYTSFN